LRAHLTIEAAPDICFPRLLIAGEVKEMAIRRLVIARRALSLVVSFGLLCGPALTVARAMQDEEVGHGSIHGTLYQADEKEHLAGAKVTAINVRTSKQYASEVTSATGNYDVRGPPTG